MTASRMVCPALLLAAALVACPTPASAQDRGDFSAGWRLLRVDAEDFEETFGAGWYADVAVDLMPMIAIVGDVAGAYKTLEETRTVAGVRVSATADVNIHTFMGGMRFSARNVPRFAPFGQLLVGGVRGSFEAEGSTTVAGRTTTVSESESSTDFGLDVGGGVNMMVTDRIGARGAASYLRIFGEDNDGVNAFRLGVGIVVSF